MTTYQYLVKVETATREQATQVMAERLSTDEWYGFDYQIEYEGLGHKPMTCSICEAMDCPDTVEECHAKGDCTGGKT